MPTATPEQESKLKYLQLEEELRRQIESGELRPGDRMPSHAELHARYGMTRPSVDRAHALLEKKGLITRSHRRGIFVAEQPAPPASGLTSVLAHSQTVVAIAAPDRAIFDRAMGLLFRHIEAADLSLTCQLVNPNSPLLIPRSEDERPLGYVVFGRALLHLAEQLQAAGQRVVLVGTPYADATPNVPVVTGDQEQGGYLATRHLLDLGHRRIAFRGWGDWPQMQRYRGHQWALTEARKQGIEVQDGSIYHHEYVKWREAPEVAEAYFRRPDAPTGIVAWNDLEAMTLLSLLSYLGVRVPQEVSIVGYDNLPQGEQVHPPLTTVDGAIEQQLQAALRLLTQPVAPSPSTTVVVLPTLISRESASPAK